jgi:hypothetical protein
MRNTSRVSIPPARPLSHAHVTVGCSIRLAQPLRESWQTLPRVRDQGIGQKRGVNSRYEGHPSRATESEGWRRGGDSNPRAPCGTRRFRGAPVTTTSVPLQAGGRTLIVLCRSTGRKPDAAHATWVASAAALALQFPRRSSTPNLDGLSPRKGPRRGKGGHTPGHS